MCSSSHRRLLRVHFQFSFLQPMCFWFICLSFFNWKHFRRDMWGHPPDKYHSGLEAERKVTVMRPGDRKEQARAAGAAAGPGLRGPRRGVCGPLLTRLRPCQGINGPVWGPGGGRQGVCLTRGIAWGRKKPSLGGRGERTKGREGNLWKSGEFIKIVTQQSSSHFSQSNAC